MSDEESRHAGGLLYSVQRLLSSLLSVVQTRIEIVATEFEEERERIKELVLYGVFALVFISLGVITLTVFVTLWLWELYGVHALGVMGLIFLGTGIALALRARSNERARPRLFAGTLAELRKDRQNLHDDHE
jgi:uncharacterized membrane protein YqjE